MRRWTAAVLSAALGWALLPGRALAQRTQPETIYGEDDRRDLYQVQNPKVLDYADSTTALFPSYKVSVDSATGRAALGVSPYGEDMGLCPEEPFYKQKNGAFCSGSLVGEDLLMTAGHCVRSPDACKSTKFVFGFGIRKEGESPESVPAGDVFGCAELLGSVVEGQGADWALIRLDRKASGRKPLAIERSGKLENTAPLFVIGHPAGLPTKVAGGATVRDASPNGYFVANLDTYGGNSGSAVFNARTGKVEGILVRGEVDYVYRNGCRVSNVCPNEGCRGEDVTKVSSLSGLIPKLADEREAPEPEGEAPLEPQAKLRAPW